MPVTLQDIDAELRLAAESFLESDEALAIDVTAKQVQLSMIFKWYREDFGSNQQQVLEFLYNHMGEGKKKQDLKEVKQKAKVTYMTYNWGINN